MADPIKHALTRRRVQRGRLVSEEPNAKLVLGVKFAIGMTLCFSALEVAHLVCLHSWNSEVFAAISGLSGTILGIFVGQKT
jgi:hypothetical protein